MEPAAKKTKLTDHFRVALKPRDLNVANHNNNNSKHQINHNVQKQQQQQPSRQLLLLPSQAGQSHQQNHDSHHHHHQPTSSQCHANALKETRSLRENLQLEPSLPRKVANRFETSPKKIEIITIEDDEATEIDEEYLAEDAHKLLDSKKKKKQQQQLLQLKVKSPIKHVEQEAIFNYDETVIDNSYWEPHYACDSFQYDRKQEIKFLIERQDLDITPQQRAELVDWLITIQIRFRLDHEPLYMAVKLADLYMTHRTVDEGEFVLVYITTMFIAAKYDERQCGITMPLLQRHARARFGVRYTIKQIIRFEVDLLTTLDFNLRFPLSYGFLRRFARCTKSDMRTINLARYILETSLMDYDMIETLESEIAAGSLLLAHEMLNNTGAWNANARHHTGYDERELFPLIIRLNMMLFKMARKKTAVRRKYSHEMFMEVAKIPPILPELLLLITREQQQQQSPTRTTSPFQLR